MEGNESIARGPDSLAQRVRRRVLAVLKERAADGLFPYQGVWLTRDEITARGRMRQRLARTWAAELLLLLLVLDIVAVVMVLLVWSLAY